METREECTLPLLQKEPQTKFPARELLAAFVSSLGSFCIGLTLGYSSPTVDAMTRDILKTQTYVSWFGSLVALGAAFGCPIGSRFTEKWGRKTTLIICSILITCGWLLVVYAPTLWLLLMGRFITGVSVGMTSVCVPIYISECTSKSHRGRFSSLVQLQCVAGIPLVYVFGVFLSWRWLAFLCTACSVVWLAALLPLPESPRKLLANNQQQEARNSLLWLRSDQEQIDTEVKEMQANLDTHASTFQCNSIFKATFTKPLGLGIAVMVFQQLGGVNVVVFYMKPIFQQAHFLPNMSYLPPILVAILQLLVTMASTLCLDKLGRRPMLLISGIGCIVSMATFGLYFLLSQRYNISGLSWLSIICIAAFLASFAMGWGAVPWVIIGEIFPLRLRGLGCGICAVTNWICAFLMTWQFSNIEAAITTYGAFWMFGGLCLLGVVIVAIFLPETKGKSLEAIEAYFEHGQSMS
jgi:SP family facilitated glucose transporter-like MFS transporter 8